MKKTMNATATETTATETTATETTATVETPVIDTYAGLTAQQVCDILNQTKNRNEHGPIIAAIESKLQEENKETVRLTVETFAHTASRDTALFWENLIMHPVAVVKALVEDTENGGYKLADRNRRILFSQVDKVFQELYNGKSIATAKNYLRMMARITDNLYRNTCNDLSADAGKDCAVIRVTAHIDGEVTMREVDFSKASKSGLKQQMQAYIDTIMPEEERVLVCSADVNYVIKGFESAKDGKVKTGNEKKVESLIFDAIKQRRIKAAYVVESTAKIHKAEEPKKSERTEKQEEVMSKVGDRPEAAATLSKPESKPEEMVVSKEEAAA